MDQGIGSPSSSNTPGNLVCHESVRGTWADDAAIEDVDIPVVSTQWSNMNTELKPSVYEHRYTYDKVGNRTVKYEFFVTNSVGSGLKWTCTYNGLNQLTQQNKYSTDGLTLDRKWLYTYDADGNLTTKEKQTSAGVKEEKWIYTWNPRNQMTLAEKFSGTNDTYAGKVAYRYCLSCDSVLSERIEYSPTSSTTIIKWWRYEYDGLNCLRVDEKYDTTGGSLDANDPWRTLEVTTHKPGSLGALIGKRVYTHTNNDATPDSTNDYTYTYDAVGNVVAVYNANSTERGYEKYYFAQDAFGNELAVSPFLSYSPPGTTVTWASARTVGITEHQTGKWIDPFTGLYFFHARWYDSGVGRFVGRDPGIKSIGIPAGNDSIRNGCFCGLDKSILPNTEAYIQSYIFGFNVPTIFVDPTGKFAVPPAIIKIIEAYAGYCGINAIIEYVHGMTILVVEGDRYTHCVTTCNLRNRAWWLCASAVQALWEVMNALGDMGWGDVWEDIQADQAGLRCSGSFFDSFWRHWYGVTCPCEDCCRNPALYGIRPYPTAH